MITPTEREVRISKRNHENGLVVLAEQLRINSKAKNILLKMGKENLLIHATDLNEESESWLTNRAEALNSAIKDIASASDSLLISSTNCCLYSEINNSIFFDLILFSVIHNNGNYSTYQLSIKLPDMASLIVISWIFP